VKNAILIIIVFGFYLVSCKPKIQKSSESDPQSAQATKSVASVVLNKDYIPSEKQTYNLDSTSLKEDILTIYVSYSGGCKEHSFELVTNGRYAESNPPQLIIFLKHDNNGDACRQLKTAALDFDVSSLKHPSAKSIKLNLNNQHIIPYNY